MKKGKDGLYHSKVTPVKGAKPIYYTGKTLREMEEKRQEIIENYKTGKNPKEMTFLGVIDEWYETVKKPRFRTRGTREHYEAELKRIHRYFSESLACRAIRYPALQAYIDSLANAASVATSMTIITAACQYAVSIGALDHNYAQSLIRPQIEPKSERKPLTTEQAEKYHSLLSSDYLLEPILYFTGMRLGEALGLQWQDIEFDSETISIHQAAVAAEPRGAGKIGPTKTKSSVRRIPISPDLAPILRAAQQKPVAFLFPSPDRAYPISQRASRDQFSAHMDSIGLTGITPHVLRHNFATACYLAKVPISIAMRWLGHSNYNMLVKVYADIETAISTQPNLDSYLTNQIEEILKKLKINKEIW